MLNNFDYTKSCFKKKKKKKVATGLRAATLRGAFKPPLSRAVTSQLML